MAEVLQPNLALGSDQSLGYNQAEAEQGYYRQLTQNRMQDRVQQRQEARQKEEGVVGQTKDVIRETQTAIQIFRLILAATPLTFLLYVLQSIARYITADLLGFEWPGVWLKLSQVEKIVMFSSVIILVLLSGLFFITTLFFNPSILIMFGLQVLIDSLMTWLKSWL